MFGMGDCKPVGTPIDPNQKISAELCPRNEFEASEMRGIPYREAIGCLLYIAQVTRPDINYAVNLFSRYSENPGHQHWIGVKRILRYLKGSSERKITYGKERHGIFGYCDADWAGDLDHRKSTTGYIFMLNGGAISWSTKKQQAVALSTTEAEYMAIVHATQEAIWLRNLREQIFPCQNDFVLIYSDNQGAIQLAKNNAYSARTKHIYIKVEFVKEKLEQKIIEIKYVPTNANIADLLTKGLSKVKHSLLTQEIGITG